MANLILVRHGESQWNEKGLWTGLTDIGLTEKGKEEARFAGNKIKGQQIDFAYTSALLRAKQTWEEIKGVLGIDVPTVAAAALRISGRLKKKSGTNNLKISVEAGISE